MAKSKNLKQYQDEWIALYQKGCSINEIARCYEVNKNSVSRLVKQKIDLRSKQLDEAIIEKMKAYWDLGYSKRMIGQMLGVSSTSVGYWLEQRYEIKRDIGRRQFEHLVPEMIDRYQKGESLNDISIDLGISNQAVATYLQRAQVERRSYSESSRQYALNETYFDHLETENSYLLGVLFAIGSIYRPLTDYLDVADSTCHQDAIIKVLMPLTTIESERICIKDNGNSFSIRIPSTYLVERLLELGIKTHFPQDIHLDEQAFWEGYLKYKSTNQLLPKQRTRWYISFKRDYLKQPFLDYLKRQGVRVDWLRCQYANGIAIESKRAKTQMVQVFPCLVEWLTQTSEQAS